MLVYFCNGSTIQTGYWPHHSSLLFLLNFIFGIRIEKNVPCNKNGCYSSYKNVETGRFCGVNITTVFIQGSKKTAYKCKRDAKELEKCPADHSAPYNTIRQGGSNARTQGATCAMILLACKWRGSAAQRCCFDWKSHSLVKASKGLHFRALDGLMKSGWFVTDLTQAQL